MVKFLRGDCQTIGSGNVQKKGENLPGFLGSTAFKTLSHNHKIINTLQKATCIGYIVESTKIYSRSGNQLSASCYKKQLSAAALFTGESS